MLNAAHPITASADPQGQDAGDEAHAGSGSPHGVSREPTHSGANSAKQIAEADALQALSAPGDTACPDYADGPGGHSPIVGAPPSDSPPAALVGAQRGLFRPIGRGPFKGLARDGYDLIMADPPWHFRVYSENGIAKSPQAHYDCMDLEAIQRLPVAQLASSNCLLWLWATNPILDKAFDVMAAWGFTFKTAGTWVKRTSGGGLAFGTGYHLRSANEPFLIGTIGNPETTNSVRSAIEGVVREHSRKPEEAFAAAEQLMPNARRIELFSRQPRPGWTGWGDQSNHFEGEAA